MMRLRLFVSLFLLFFGTSYSAWASMCHDAIRQVERQYRLPYQLLDAIAATESGRYDGAAGKVQAWPWTINVEGAGHYYNNKAEAITAVENFRRKGKTSIDVGCMQINQKHHPRSFSSLNEAFDPMANVTYAAQFLNELKAKHKTWARAIAHYHSGSPDRQLAYKRRILTAWRKQRGEVVTTTASAKNSLYQQVASIERAKRYNVLNQRQQRGLKVIRFSE